MKTKAINTIKYILISTIFILSINNYFFSEYNPSRLTSLNVLFLVLTIFILKYYDSVKTRQDRIMFGFSFLYSLALIIGKNINETNSIYSLIFPLKNFILTIIEVICFTYVFGVLVTLIINKIRNLNIREINVSIDKKKFVLIWLLIFVTFIPAIIAYYPGISSYDIHALNCQALGMVEYSILQPPLYTFIYQIIINIGNLIGLNPLVLYSILQMIFMSYSLAYLLRFIINRKTNLLLVILSVLFIIINPVIAIFSIIPVKDVVNALVMMLITIKIIEYFHDRRKTRLYIISALILFSSLLRHNMFYAYLLSLVIIIIIGYKKCKEIIIAMVIPLCLCVIINGPIYSMLGIIKDNTQESLSVPAQQIATVVVRHEDSIENDLKEEINKYLPIEKIKPQFNPRFADPMKAELKTKEIRNNKSGFIKAWVELGIKNPCDYIDAFLNSNLPIWYPDANPIDKYSQAAYIEDQQAASLKVGELNFDQINTETSIYKFYHSFATFEKLDCVPILSNIFSLSSPIWILLLVLFIYLRDRKTELIISILPYLVMWVTLLGGPVSNMRYVFPIFIMYPYFICTSFSKK